MSFSGTAPGVVAFGPITAVTVEEAIPLAADGTTAIPPAIATGAVQTVVGQAHAPGAVSTRASARAGGDGASEGGEGQESLAAAAAALSTAAGTEGAAAVRRGRRARPEIDYSLLQRRGYGGYGK